MYVAKALPKMVRSGKFSATVIWGSMDRLPLILYNKTDQQLSRPMRALAHAKDKKETTTAAAIRRT